MKNLLILTSLLISSAVIAQKTADSDIPIAVKSKFQKNYANATDVEWEKEDNAYEVEFELNGLEQKIKYNEEGMILKQKEEINKMEIPVAIQNTLDTKYKGRKMDDVEKITKEGKVYYKVEFEGTLFDDEVLFNSEGKVEDKNKFK